MVKRQHVVPREKDWAVTPEKGERASKVFRTKIGAIRHAHAIATRNQVGMVLHGSDGRIRRWDNPPHLTTVLKEAAGM